MDDLPHPHQRVEFAVVGLSFNQSEQGGHILGKDVRHGFLLMVLQQAIVLQQADVGILDGRMQVEQTGGLIAGLLDGKHLLVPIFE